MDKTVGFIDIGTNSIHMLVVRFYEGSLGTPIYHDKESVRMGKSLYEKGYIDGPTMEKSRFVISKFAGVAESFGATEIIAMATCAAREASNRSELVDMMRGCGIELRVIPGLEEARLIRLGVLGPDVPVRTLCIDVGGGSTEVALADGRENLYLDSMSLGALRLAYGSGIDQSGPVTFRQYDALRRMVDTASYRTVGKVRELGFERAVGSSGTIMAMAEMCGVRRGDGDGSYMTYDEVVSLMKDICSMDVKGRLSIPKMSSSRADIIVGGGAVVEELMYLLGIRKLDISPNGLREGMQADYLLQHGHSDFDIRSSSVISLAARCGCDRGHYERVRRYAGQIYDSLTATGMLDLDPRWRQLLGYAAVLHDVGEFIAYEKHNVLSYIIIRNSYLAGFDSEELECLALIARFHHNSIPGPSSKYFADVDRADVQAVRRCALVLKMADILDRGRDGAVEEAQVTVSGGSPTLCLKASKDISMAVWKLKTIKDDFFNVFHVKIAIEVVSASERRSLPSRVLL